VTFSVTLSDFENRDAMGQFFRGISVHSQSSTNNDKIPQSNPYGGGPVYGSQPCPKPSGRSSPSQIFGILIYGVIRPIVWHNSN